ncbi:MAG: hypothetical protein J7L38_07690 [Thermoproteales archaeon]|nr:hypothetical protein [Thermoproteales archaeon]
MFELGILLLIIDIILVVIAYLFHLRSVRELELYEKSAEKESRIRKIRLLLALGKFYNECFQEPFSELQNMIRKVEEGRASIEELWTFIESKTKGLEKGVERLLNEIKGLEKPVLLIKEMKETEEKIFIYLLAAGFSLLFFSILLITGLDYVFSLIFPGIIEGFIFLSVINLYSFYKKHGEYKKIHSLKHRR